MDSLSIGETLAKLKELDAFQPTGGWKMLGRDLIAASQKNDFGRMKEIADNVNAAYIVLRA